MSRWFAKLGFIHRRLWQQDGLYRAGLLFGPAPLVGCLVASALWLSVETLVSAPHQTAAWGVPQGPETWGSDNDQPHIVAPTKPLPPANADGGLPGYEPGWRVTTAPIQVSPTLDVDVKTTRLTGFVIDEPSAEMGQIIAGGPKEALYVGIGSGFLAVRTAGVYALSARIDRPAAQVADCLIRVVFGQRRIISNLEVAMTDDVSKAFDGARFDLRPGLYSIGWAFGCWHGQEVTGPGRVTFLVEQPGESTFRPARPDEIVRMAPTRP